jgi:hypothetical protein
MILLKFNKYLYTIFIILFIYFLYNIYYLNNQYNINYTKKVKFRDEFGGNLIEIIKFKKIDF